MKNVILGIFGAFAIMFATPAMAQGVDVGELQDMAEDVVGTQCFGALKDAVQAHVGPKYQAMRGACAQFRGCKKTCRSAKKDAKADARADKKDCKAECKGKKGKAKRDCNKSCRQDFRADKKDARAAKRDCKADCRAAYLQGPCKSARKEFWKEIANTVKDNAGQCAQDIQALING
ncbi:MAG: hypothetical protein KC613_21345 [Myxococcales bacterium]|nr:hypothetical protein [Myxococcales bacterium]